MMVSSWQSGHVTTYMLAIRRWTWGVVCAVACSCLNKSAFELQLTKFRNDVIGVWARPQPPQHFPRRTSDGMNR